MYVCARSTQGRRQRQQASRWLRDVCGRVTPWSQGVVCLLRVQMEGNCFSLSALERRIGAIFFYWDVYNMFLQVGRVVPGQA